MAHSQSPITPTDYDAFPSLTRAATAPIGLVGGPRPDRSRLAPEDAFYAQSPPRSGTGLSGPPPTTATNASASNSNGGGAAALGLEARSRRVRAALGGQGSRSRSRRRKRMWKKLLWVKQSYPDNYTDRATFLENLQRNPRPPFYDFWPLVADSTVIVQHVCSVIIFIVCFVGIFQERVSPLTVVSCSTLATFLGWLLWERWVADEEGSVGEDKAGRDGLGVVAPGHHHGGAAGAAPGLGVGRSGSLRRTGGGSIRRPPPRIRRDDLTGVANGSTAASAASSTSNLSLGAEQRPHRHVYSTSTSSLLSQSSTHGSLPAQTGASSAPKSSSEESLPSSLRGVAAPAAPATDSTPDADDGDTRTGDDIGRSPQRLGTIKSAILIYSTLLSLSPILKSLTRSTSSDSIWSMSFWLLTINIFFFDYSGGVVGVRFPASLSTNAALMASTVLASRLPSTGQVFSLTLFSIEVFGLFPVFRRYSRHRSWRWHVLLTVLLVLGAGCGVGMILGDSNGLPWRSGLVGMAVGALIAVVAMGGCSWWLIGLQKYKNEISGPWDPARPIIISRRHWDDG